MFEDRAATLSIDRLREVLDYDATLGIFIWKIVTSNRVKVGAIAGNLNSEHVVISIDGTKHWAHHLAIYYVEGKYPTCEVDHRNGVPWDNSYVNLRRASPLVNAQNRNAPSKNNVLQRLGVYRCKHTGRFRVQLLVKGRKIHVGRFDTPDLAHAAYVEAKRQHHEGNTL